MLGRRTRAAPAEPGLKAAAARAFVPTTTCRDPLCCLGSPAATCVRRVPRPGGAHLVAPGAPDSRQLDVGGPEERAHAAAAARRMGDTGREDRPVEADAPKRKLVAPP